MNTAFKKYKHKIAHWRIALSGRTTPNVARMIRRYYKTHPVRGYRNAKDCD